MTSKAPSEVRHFGWIVSPMWLSSPGSSDAVEHTIRHFLNAQEEWERVEPRDALDPRGVRNQVPVEWRLETFSSFSEPEGRRINAKEWWLSPRLPIVLKAHADGYYPRYANLVRMAGEFLAPGSAWSKGKTPQRIRAEVDGCVIAGDLRTSNRFQVISAYRSYILKQTKPTSLGTLGDRLKARCQELRAVASSPQELIP